MGKHAGLLQVTICQVSCGVGGGDDATLDLLQKASAPQGQRFTGGEKHSPHTWLGSVHTADHRRVIRYNLGEVCGMMGDISGKSFEVH